MKGACPRCAKPLDTTHPSALCHHCRGLWVVEASVAEMIAEMQGKTVPDVVAFAPGDGEHLACPVCARPMEPGTLEGIAVDRCTADGFWFDADELGEILRRSRKHAPEAPSFLDRLLRRK